MKIMLLACIITVFTTTGCIIRDGHGGWHHHWHGEMRGGPVVAQVQHVRQGATVTAPIVNAPPSEIVIAAR